MQKKSGQVALGGIATGMCIALMFATGMIPFPTTHCRRWLDWC